MTYAIIAILLFILELLYFKIADRFNIIDKPNLRSSHSKITIRGGGIIFIFAIWLHAAFFGLQYPWFVVALSCVGLISMADDIHRISHIIRLIIQFAAVILLFGQWFNVHDLPNWGIIAASSIFCVGILNAYNFMDGINGITGGYSLVVLAPLMVLNAQLNFIQPSLLYVVGISLLVFCFFNFRKKAKCFAGDVGSISIAFTLLFILGSLIIATGNFAYITFLVVYGVDVVLTICHRIMLHENIGEAHRKHVYQIMANELKIPHIMVSLIYMALQLLISFGLLYIPMNQYLYLGLVVALLSVAYILFIKKFYHLHAEYLARASQ